MRTTSRNKRTTSLKRNDLYLIILQSIQQSNKLPDTPFIKDGILQSNKRQWYVNYLNTNHLIEKKGYGTWDITDKGLHFLEELQVESRRVIKPLKLDFTMRLTIPILKELESGFESDIERKVKGWVKKYRWHNVPFYNYDLTFEKTTKSLIVNVHHMEISEPTDVDVIANHVREFVTEYFSTRRILLLDKINARVSYLKYGIADDKVKQLIPEGHYPTFYLGRKREKILPTDQEQEAEVHLDSTPFNWTIHSNDKTYVERYIKMPEVVDALDKKLVPAIDRLTEQIELHIQATKEWKDTAIDIRKNLELLPKEDGWKLWRKRLNNK